MGTKEATSSSKVATSDEKVASPTFPIIHGSDTNRSNGIARVPPSFAGCSKGEGRVWVRRCFGEVTVG
jgi:hypothetical protein